MTLKKKGLQDFVFGRTVGSLLCNSSPPLPVESRKLGLIMVSLSMLVMSSRLTSNVFSDTYIVCKIRYWPGDMVASGF